MKEQRRHQRIRFGVQPLIRIGQSGLTGIGRLENLSLGGLMLRTDLPLRTGKACGCEFSVFGSALVDLSAMIVSRVGDLFCARFEAGPISESLIGDVIDRALATGKASVLSLNETHGRRVMRVTGGLNGCLQNDFMHGLTKVGVDVIDLSGVTDIDQAGVELCRIAVERHQVGFVRPSSCVHEKLAGLGGRLAC